jgi:hypothetical protein
MTPQVPQAIFFMQYVVFFGRFIYNLPNITAGRFSCCATQIGDYGTFVHADFVHWVVSSNNLFDESEQ